MKKRMQKTASYILANTSSERTLQVLVVSFHFISIAPVLSIISKLPKHPQFPEFKGTPEMNEAKKVFFLSFFV